MTKPSPYIGITGIMPGYCEDILSMKLHWENATKNSVNLRHELLFGVLVSEKTILGYANSLPNQFPKVRNWELLETGRDLDFTGKTTIIHYCCDDISTLCQQVLSAICWSGGFQYVGGVQINSIWPNPLQMKMIKKYAPDDFRIIMQITGKKLDYYKFVSEAKFDPKKLDLEYYEDAMTDILFDPSGGKGVDTDFESLVPVIRMFKERFPGVGIGVAGGLCAETIPNLLPLLREFPDLSFDAQGKLRNNKDHLDLNKATGYIFAAVEVLQLARK